MLLLQVNPQFVNRLKLHQIISSYWKNVDVENKVEIINKFADLLEANQEKLVKICVLEAGKNN